MDITAVKIKSPKSPCRVILWWADDYVFISRFCSFDIPQCLLDRHESGFLASLRFKMVLETKKKKRKWHQWLSWYCRWEYDTLVISHNRYFNMPIHSRVLAVPEAIVKYRQTFTCTVYGLFQNSCSRINGWVFWNLVDNLTNTIWTCFIRFQTTWYYWALTSLFKEYSQLSNDQVKRISNNRHR